MNLSEMRQRVFDQMDYNPDLQQYRDSVARRINDQYQLLNDSANWLFLTNEQDIQLRKSVTGTTGVTVTKDGTNNRLIVATGFTFTPEMAGQFITDGGSNKYVLVAIKSPTEAFVEPVSDGDNSGGYVTSGADAEFKITFDRFPLPSDLIEILGFMDRDADRGRMSFINRKAEETAYLDRDKFGDPSVIVDDDFVANDAPIKNPTLTVISLSPANNQLEPGVTYEYKYTVYREGRESPPSKVATITTQGTGIGIRISNLDNTAWGARATLTSPATLYDSGIHKRIYRRDATNHGRWILIGIVNSLTTSFTDQELFPTSIGIIPDKSFASYNYNVQEDFLHFMDPGPVQYVRFYYRPDTDRKIVLRYQYRPRDLISDTDAPVWPRQYHILLVYKCLEDMFLQMQDIGQAQIFSARAMGLMEQMRRRYLSRQEVKKRFHRWDQPRRYRNFFGPPTTDFTGA